MNITLKLLACLASVLLLVGCAPSGQPENTYRQISQEGAARLMQEQSDYILLDVRTQAEFAQAHIPGAICIPNETIGTEEIPALPTGDISSTSCISFSSIQFAVP